MDNLPRTREFYRPLVEDIHEAAREWRGSFLRLRPIEALLVAGVLLAGPVLLFILVQYFASLRSDIEPIPAPVTPQVTLTRSFEQRGARFGRDAQGIITQATLKGEHFTGG